MNPFGDAWPGLRQCIGCQKQCIMLPCSASLFHIKVGAVHTLCFALSSRPCGGHTLWDVCAHHLQILTASSYICTRIPHISRLTHVYCRASRRSLLLFGRHMPPFPPRPPPSPRPPPPPLPPPPRPPAPPPSPPAAEPLVVSKLAQPMMHEMRNAVQHWLVCFWQACM